MENRQRFQNAKAIITVSENTKQDLMKVYQSINESKIHVIHHGIDGNLNRSSKSPNNNINSQFILYVGHREGYKNFEFILPVGGGTQKITQDKVSCSRYQIYQFGNSNDYQIST